MGDRGDALRAFLAWVLADAVGSSSAWLFPAALGCLVASRAYGVTRSAAVPRLLPSALTLVSANSRLALAGVGGAAVGGVLAGALSRVDPEWSLRLAFGVYVAGTVLAILLPARVDSLRGEQGPAGAAPGGGSAPLFRRGRLRGRLEPAERCRPRLVVLRRWAPAGWLPHPLPGFPAA